MWPVNQDFPNTIEARPYYTVYVVTVIKNVILNANKAGGTIHRQF
jgi:hypothetical protein